MLAMKEYNHHEVHDNLTLDRLSSLPDYILITIISLLPINSAAATSVLSRRWRHLWTHITHLFFTPPWTNTFRDFGHFLATIHVIITQLIISSKLHSFDLHFPRCYMSHAETRANQNIIAYLLPWISIMCSRNVEVIKICFKYDILEIPILTFHSESLVSLELSENVKLKFLNDNDQIMLFNLPCLKRLRMSLYDSHRSLMRTFSKSCPRVEEVHLLMILWENGHFVDITASNLKLLRIDMKDSVAEDCMFVIDAPKLEKFELKGILAFYDFVTNPCRLQEAKLSLDLDTFNNIYFDVSMKLGLFEGISCVRSLILQNCGLKLLSYFANIVMPTFQNMVHLSLICGSARVDFDNIDWNVRIPRQFLSKLKKIEVLIGNAAYGPQLKFLNDILSKAKVLEQLNVSLFKYVEGDNDSSRNQLWNEFKFCNELFMLPRRSLRCQIEFSGNAITTSSNDFSQYV